MGRFNWLVLFLISLFIIPFSAHAVLPPDVVFSVGTQIFQIITVVSAMFMGAVMAILPFIKRFIDRLRKHKSVLVLFGVAIFFCALGVLLAIFLNYSQKTSVQVNIPNDNVQAVGYRFYSDRFVIARKNEKGEPLLVDLIISRKENLTGGFDHYYLGNIIAYGKNGQFYEEKFSTNRDIIPDLFFSSFKKVKAVDNSSRDTYTFSFSLLGSLYHVSIDELTSDFITKNEPEYTSYASVGNARVVVEGDTFDAHIMHQGIYSDDYRPKIFFDERGKIPSETIQLILWAENNTFLLVDRSNVFKISPAYSSHFWALSKDSMGQIKKAFKGEADKKINNNVATFNALIPEFGGTAISATLTSKFRAALDKGWVEAKVTTPFGTSNFYGLGYYNEYNQGNE